MVVQIKTLLAAAMVMLPSSTNAQAINISTTPSQAASPVIGTDYIGFAIECASFPNFTDNQFSLNMFGTFTKRSRGSPLNLRLGGTSQDVSSWHPEFKGVTYLPDGNSKGLRSPLWIGQGWMDAFGKLQNTRYELQIPLAIKNITNGIAFLKAAINAMGEKNLYTIEIGNEPNLYPNTARPASYNSSEYVQELHGYQAAIEQNVPYVSGKQIFRNLDLAWGYKPDGPFNVANTFKEGLNSNNKTSVVSLHYYGTGTQNTMANLLSIPIQDAATDVFRSTVNYVRKGLGIPVILGEVGDVLGNTAPSQSSSLGSAVWAANWLLYTMTIGISRINMQLFDGASYNAWQPRNNTVLKSPPGVLGPFYGLVMIADLISAADKGLKVEQQTSPVENVTVYSAYNGGKLSSVLAFNHMLWTRDMGPRPNATIELQVGSFNEATIMRLTGDGGLSTQNMTWAGQEWEYPSGQPRTIAPVKEVVRVTKGIVKVNIPATSGCMVVLT